MLVVERIYEKNNSIFRLSLDKNKSNDTIKQIFSNKYLVWCVYRHYALLEWIWIIVFFLRFVWSLNEFIKFFLNYNYLNKNICIFFGFSFHILLFWLDFLHKICIHYVTLCSSSICVFTKKISIYFVFE